MLVMMPGEQGWREAEYGGEVVVVSKVDEEGGAEQMKIKELHLEEVTEEREESGAGRGAKVESEDESRGRGAEGASDEKEDEAAVGGGCADVGRRRGRAGRNNAGTEGTWDGGAEDEGRVEG